MRYSQAKGKFRKLFDTIKNNETVLDDKKNEQLFLNFFKQNLKTHFSIYDTGWLAKAVDINFFRTIRKGDMIPESLSVNYIDDLEIPDIFLPYLDVLVLIKTPPDSILTTYTEYTLENWIDDYIRIKGNGSLIFRSDYPLTSNNLVSQSQIDNGDIPEANTKKVYNTQIYYTEPTSGDDFFVSGEVIGIQTRLNPETCDKDGTPVNILDFFNCRPFMSAFADYHKITDLDVDGFTGIGDLEDQEFTAPSPDCTVSITDYDQVTNSYTFSSVYGYSIFVDGVITNLTQQTTSSGLIEIIGSYITSKTFAFQGFRPYYSSLTQREITVVSAGDLLLTNLPDTLADETLPYNSITLERNPDGFPTTTDTETDLFLQSSDGTITNGNPIRKDVAFFKIADADDNRFPYYHMKIQIGATILSPAIVEDPNPTVITQDDIYTKVGTTYSRTTNVDGSKSNGTYITEGKDVQYRLMIVVKNPLVYQEVRKYDTTQ